MKSKENIVFLGMMGSGKTSMGLIISKKLNLNFFDIDQEIENTEGTKISKIFATKGEDYFRRLEEKVSLNLLSKKKSVISLGGGGFLNKNIRNEVLKFHISFWLNWENKTIINRIQNSSKRPIANKASYNELIDLIKNRSNIYSKAKYKINCDNLSKNEIINKILKIYETH